MIDNITREKIEYLKKNCKMYCKMYNLTGNVGYKHNALKSLDIAQELYKNATKLCEMEGETNTLTLVDKDVN